VRLNCFALSKCRMTSRSNSDIPKQKLFAKNTKAKDNCIESQWCSKHKMLGNVAALPWEKLITTFENFGRCFLR